jgi:uncharacterized protein
MRVRSFLGVVATLLAIATSTSVSVAGPDWPKSLTLVTGPPGGVYYVYGEALAQVLTEKLGNDTPFQAVVLQRSGIATLEQLDKKRIGVGSRAGTGGTYMPAMLKVLGISAEINYGSFDNMATELLAGRIDAVLTLLGTPVPAVQDVEAKEPVTFITLSPEQIEAIRKALPEFSPSKIAAGTYRLLDKDYVTIGVYNFAIGRADLPEDLVYQLVKAVFENQPRLLKAHSAASETIPQNADKNTFLPFHPGAVRYYREIGMSIPESLVPTN